MRRKLSFQPYLPLIVTLLLLINMPPRFAHRLRETAISALSPLFNVLATTKASLKESYSHITSKNTHLKEELQKLQIENQRLNVQLVHLAQLLQQPKPEFPSIAARVICREPASWNHSLWINVGAKKNEEVGQNIIAVNSPVLLGTSLIGIVEYVGTYQSRVRLITDPKVTPSVRSTRGTLQNQFVVDQVDALLLQLQSRDQLKDERIVLEKPLLALKKRISEIKEPTYHAKGELFGSSTHLWRSSSQILRGSGFNYDFADDHGPARDLRTGSAINGKNAVSSPILQVGDLLVTTGMDGVFPEGLHVGEVSWIDTLREGAYYYDIEAKPTAGSLDQLSVLFVIAPILR